MIAFLFKFMRLSLPAALSFCKRTIRNESAYAFRQVRVQRDRFVSLSDLSDEGSEALATYDLYPQ